MMILILIVRRQGLALGATTCANCTPGFYCAAGSLNVFGGTNITGAHCILASNYAILFIPVFVACFHVWKLQSLCILHFSVCAMCCRCALPRCHLTGADTLRVSTIAGSGATTPFTNGVGLVATFYNPYGMVIDASGTAYVADYLNHRVRQIVVSTGAVTTLAGSGTVASTDGTGTAAAFSNPLYVALDGLGNLYVTDWGTHRIRKVVLATQAVTTVAGSGTGTFADGAGVAASFNQPYGIVCDASGNAYVADHGNHRIRKIVLSSATVTTLAGSGAPSSANGVGAAAGFNRPINVVVDSSGTLLFVADHDNRMIRQIVIATQTVTTLAGSGTSGSANGVGIAAQFMNPQGLALDSFGNLFVGDTGSNLIRRIVIVSQTVTTIVGAAGAGAWVDGIGTNAAIKNPTGLATDARGNVYETDSSNHRVRVMQPTVPCPAGVYCAPGSDAVPCTPGYFCALGADRVACAQGYFCPPGSSAQVACPAGAYHCPAGLTAPVSIACAAGYDSSTSTRGMLFLFSITRSLICSSAWIVNDYVQARSGAGCDHVRRLHAGILLCGGLAECAWRHQYHGCALRTCR